METVSSSLNTSDDSGVDLSAGLTTPDGSPIFSASPSTSTIETRFTSLLDLTTSDDAPSSQIRKKNLPDILDPATAGGLVVKNVCFIGAGYVGVPTAAVIALKNPFLRVTVVDRDEFRIRRWNSAHLPIDESGLSEVVRITRDGSKACSMDAVEPSLPRQNGGASIPARRPNLIFTTQTAKSIAEADMIFICVNTPTKMTGLGKGYATDMTAVESVVKEVAANAKTDAILVEKSTVPCRTAKLVQDILETFRPRARMQVLSNPEFLSEGTAVKNLLYPDRIIIGSSNTVQGRRAGAALAKLYSTWVDRSKILGTHVWSSELAKLVANAMLAQRISSINSISAICETTGADVHEVAKSVGLDPRIGSQFLKAGLGFGGSCFRKDIGSLVYLARSLGLEEVAEYWNQVLVINDLQRSRFARNVIQRLNGTLVGKKIAILGFAFKKNTSDTRESLAVDIIRALLNERPAEIAIFDPWCSPANIQRELASLGNHACIKVYTDPYQGCADSNAILVVTDWDSFRTPSPADERNVVKQPQKSDTAAFSTLAAPTQSASTFTGVEMEQYLPEPACPENCPECKTSFIGFNPDEHLEWARISYHMRKPKLVFDGRDVVDAAEMERVGIKVEALGRADNGILLF
ncbi:UDP-glucose dehydrogenase [Lepidopterella palustris CBS 459.81]|uniref:UDP-glucose 6-dehydrogenase n=1 Tax=Lepidopterella palustris CBS 459.81 TaxID=1314670 RepID=A0A8E2EH79_9PEZI|nr:UDP-glucose dehydrogenase [Lepidopterella palustris CBS 459.81]